MTLMRSLESTEDGPTDPNRLLEWGKTSIIINNEGMPHPWISDLSLLCLTLE